MNTLISKVLQWGIDKGITGPHGKGTAWAQADKMLEEANETHSSVYWAPAIPNERESEARLEAIKDGIGDTTVTLILLAELHGWTLEECLQHAYDVISKRTGTMVGGTFVKDIDDDLGELDTTKACRLGDETCESCQ